MIKEKHVIITSDMYLNEKTIKAILINSGIPIPEKLYLSSTLMATKRFGSLFRQIEIDMDTKNIIHLGDNLISDFWRPRVLGLGSYIIQK